MVTLALGDGLGEGVSPTANAGEVSEITRADIAAPVINRLKLGIAIKIERRGAKERLPRRRLGHETSNPAET